MHTQFSGHYLFIESSSPRILNDTARLFSPVYSPPEAPLVCFTFWYHMYGSTIGKCFPSILKRQAFCLPPDGRHLAERDTSLGGRASFGSRRSYLTPPPPPSSFLMLLLLGDALR